MRKVFTSFTGIFMQEQSQVEARAVLKWYLTYNFLFTIKLDKTIGYLQFIQERFFLRN